MGLSEYTLGSKESGQVEKEGKYIRKRSDSSTSIRYRKEQNRSRDVKQIIVLKHVGTQHTVS